ncbi:MAG: GNAT family N-acetyltransferase [Spirochaetales bacterium]|nr:GNAT family N-acetyltransferase [Spirochaetales bacterium]
MTWDVLKRKDFYQIKDLIIPKEWKCVSFSSRFIELNKYQFTNKNDCTILANRGKDKKNIGEAIMLTRNGLILPLLDQAQYKRGDTLLEFFLASINRYMSKLHSIMGLTYDVAFIENFLPFKPTTHVEYYLMTITEKSLIKPEFSLSPDILIKSAQPKDAEKLFSLQKKYELEEVFVIPSHFQPKICLSHLRMMIKNNIIIYAEKNNIPIAKVQTNARGFFTDQIGGVYTLQEERRNGYAHYLLYLLLNKIFQKKGIVSLFVKKSNTSAISLYKKLGFHIRDNFRISYFFEHSSS